MWREDDCLCSTARGMPRLLSTSKRLHRGSHLSFRGVAGLLYPEEFYSRIIGPLAFVGERASQACCRPMRGVPGQMTSFTTVSYRQPACFRQVYGFTGLVICRFAVWHVGCISKNFIYVLFSRLLSSESRPPRLAADRFAVCPNRSHPSPPLLIDSLPAFDM